MAGIVVLTIFGAVLFCTVQIQASSGLNAHGITNPAQAGFLTSVASRGVPVGVTFFARAEGGLLPAFQWLGYAGFAASAAALVIAARRSPVSQSVTA